MKPSFRTDAYIDGKWRSGAKRFQVFNPATQDVIAEVPDLGAAETEEAIAAAHRAFPAWAAKPAKERAQIMRAWFDLMMADLDRLGRLISLEGGKPIAEGGPREVRDNPAVLEAYLGKHGAKEAARA